MSSLLADIARRRQLEAIRGKPKAQASGSSSSSATGPSLNEVLQARGFTTSPAAPGRKNILSNGRIVLENVHAGEVWDWLRTGAAHQLGHGKPAAKAKKRKAKKRAKAAKPASTPKAPKKKKAKKRRAKKAKKKAGKKKRAKAPKRKKAKKKKAK